MFLQLLAVLHHIIYPGEQHADLQDRIVRSSAALESRAKSWVNKAQELQVRKESARIEAIGLARYRCLLLVLL